MARSRALDYLQSYHFWLIEISVSERAPFFAAGALTHGFQSISMPEITADTQSFRPANSLYPVNYNASYSTGAITLTRGVTPYDSSFYRWIRRTTEGSDRIYRNFLLLHFSSIGVDSGGEPLALSSVVEGVGIGNLETLRGFGKGYILWDCLPTRYKAGSDLEGNSGDVSLAELDIQPYYFTEFSLDPLQLTD
jgi:hypothetical protein